MNELIQIGDKEISVKEWKGQRVVTFKDIDYVHGRPEGTALRNFNKNRNRFIEKEDYYIVSSDEIRRNHVFSVSESDFRDKALITEQGYLMLVKSFTDDLAWTVQRQLVNGYFRVRQVINEELSPQMKVLMNMVNQMAENELAQKRLQAEVEKQGHSIEVIKEAVKPILDNWREEINKKVSRIQQDSKINYGILRAEMYKELESRAGVNLNARLRNLKERMTEKGYKSSEIGSKNNMDVIDQDKKLREIFGKIVSEYEMKYCS